MKLCDECGAKCVNNKEFLPLFESYGNEINRIPNGECRLCGKIDTITDYSSVRFASSEKARLAGDWAIKNFEETFRRLAQE